MLRLITFLVLLAPSATLAEPVYRWTDEEGLHYSNDPQAVPKGVKAEVTNGAELGEVKQPGPKEAPDTTAATEVATKAERDAVRAENERQSAEAERQWRETFRNARKKVADIEQQLDKDRAAVADPTAAGMPVAHDMIGGVYPSREYEKTRARVRKNELELKKAKDALDELERDASNKAVPREWRQ